MKQSKGKINRRTSPDGSAHVYLLVPPVLYDWLDRGRKDGGFKNVQDKILDVLRTARDSENREQQPA